MERIELQGELCKLVGSIFLPEHQPYQQVLIGLPGKGGPKERFSKIGQALSLKGIVTVTLDFSGRGESLTSDIPPVRQQINDLEHLLSYTLDRFSESELTIAATSMGALSACLLSSRFPIKRLILVAPTIIPDRLLDVPFSDISAEDVLTSPREEFVNSKMMEAFSRFAGQVVLVKLKEDDLIPADFFEIYRNKARSLEVLDSVEIEGSHGILHDERARPGLISLLENCVNNTI